MEHTPFACDMSALDPDQRARHRVLAGRLRPIVRAFEELENGYAVRFDPEPATVVALAEFITLERRCCPFFGLSVELEPEHGPLFLRVVGPSGVKPFIRAEFGIP
jgi:hypothetical protein